MVQNVSAQGFIVTYLNSDILYYIIKFDGEHPSWHMYSRYNFSIPQAGNQSQPTLVFAFIQRLLSCQVSAYFSHHQDV
jgi:hypothetical protein